MDWKRFQEPSFVASALSCGLVTTMLAFRSGAPSQSEVIDVRSQLKQLQSSIKTTESRLEGLIVSVAKLSGAETTSSTNATLPRKVIDTRSELHDIKSSVRAAEVRLERLETGIAKLQKSIDQQADSTLERDTPNFELHTKDEAYKLIASLGKSPSSEQLAECIAEIDGWVGTPESSNELQEFKVLQISSLRKLIAKELIVLHESALKAETGSRASEFHAKASQILALFPIDSSKVVLDEARTFSSKHSEVGARIEVIRRQRYNAWALTRIEETLKAINSIATSLKTSDNPMIIAATVKQLGDVDPVLLESVVAQLYNYAVEQAKSNISPEQQLELGRGLIDPSIKRKGYGDF